MNAMPALEGFWSSYIAAVVAKIMELYTEHDCRWLLGKSTKAQMVVIFKVIRRDNYSIYIQKLNNVTTSIILSVKMFSR